MSHVLTSLRRVWHHTWHKVRGALTRESGATPSAMDAKQLCFLTFQHTGEVIQAERLLREAGHEVAVMGPPPSLQHGCDMVLVVDLVSALHLCELLGAANLPPLQTVPIANTMLEPVSLYHEADFGDWFMVRAANMKVTFEKATGRIVNVSGGGCPDVPYLAARIMGHNLDEAEEPRAKGQSLCAYSLQHAFMEARRLWHTPRG